MSAKPPEGKALIPLSLGDPTVYGNFKVPDHVLPVMDRELASYKINGYGHSCGTDEARESVARRFGTAKHPLTKDDVILASGCSQALDLVFKVIAEPFVHNVVLPRPGFSIYATILHAMGVECRFYDLIPHKGWVCDVSHMESLCDDKTAAILINNPSNPCGSVFPRQHVVDIVSLCSKKRIPLISDEIYADMAFRGHEFVSAAEVSEDVPILIVGGLAKQYMVPGWRIGWVCVHDRNDVFSDVRSGLHDLSTLTIHPATPMQALVKPLLEDTPASYYSQVMDQLEVNMNVFKSGIAEAPGLTFLTPQGAMYGMIEVDPAVLGVEDEVEFAKELLKEEAVFVLPGSCFQIPNFVRIVVTPPREVLEDAAQRITAFCKRRVA
mmetsp:Transcript_36802/g.80414  ORF Transcript_36802/g.80414 Transcript_36802/m.80414 type:complete len:381 (-) Transcript_36802:282-1424(-)